ncbi:hypothetical protein TNIN_81931 [Trichonephila inaurata madagascariensis]|uniref:Uncharacterized protein n=1 Tax=Trichonephila inaurata madagascariensis TaxID=2747483 RepID=A0A8X6Y1X3_9ARAC|nr:hypothetical protein TNIN_81931 [Trichonephila inaurata madagascariensis]
MQTSEKIGKKRGLKTGRLFQWVTMSRIKALSNVPGDDVEGLITHGAKWHFGFFIDWPTIVVNSRKADGSLDRKKRRVF